MSTFTNTAREVEMPNGDVVVIHNAPTGGENTTSNIKKFKYDDNGHVTESTAADAEDLNLSGYSTPTTGSTDIGTSDDVQTAIGKLDHQSHIDQTNILSVQENTPSMSVSNSKTLTTSKGYCYLTDWTKNLLNANLDLCKNMNSDRTWNGNSTTYRGVTYTVDDATHSITFDGTSSSSNTSRIYLSPVLETSKYSDYWAVGVNTSDTGVGFGFTYCQNPDGSTWLKDEIDQGVGTKVNTEYPYFRVTIKVEKGHTADNLSVQPMFMKGTTPHVYVAYDGYTVTSSNSDSTETDSVFVGTETPSPVMLKTYEGTTVITSSGEIEVVIPNNTQAEAIANSDVITHENRAALAEVIDDNVKNLIPFPYSVESRTQRGITFLPDSKGVIHITGTNDGTGNSYFPIISESTPIPILEDGETYMLVCNVTGTGTINAVYMNEFRNGSAVTLGNITSLSAGVYTVPITYSKESGDTGESCAIKITSGTYSGAFDLYISIMVCKKALYDISQNYEPYALGNQVLTPALIEQVDDGAKNLIPSQFVTSTYNGASFVWGENGSFTASRVSEGVYTTYNILKNFELPVGHYVLSIGSALIANYEVKLVLSDSSTKTLNSTTDTYVDFTITQGLSINYLYISVGTNATSSVTIYPMICSKADWDISSKYKPYVPYDISKVVETNSTVNNDLNNCIDTSVVYRCVNSSSLPANCPNFKFNNVSSFEMTCTTPAVNIILQELKPNSFATLPRIYYRRRTGAGTEQSPYVWSNWETMNCRYPVISGINYNDCDETGFYEVMGTVTSNTQNSPNGNNASNNFFVIVQRRDAVYIKQIACDVRTTDVYNRNCINGTWSDWVKLATASDIAALDTRIQALENT